MKIYIYKITNLINNKIYIGYHTYKSKVSWNNYYGSGKIIKNIIKKYGKENFKKEILFIVYNKHNACLLEKFYIRKNKSNKNKYGYNLTKGGNGRGEYIMPEETRKKMSIYGKTLVGDKNPMFGKHFKHSEETKRKMSEKAKLRIGDKAPMFGKYHSNKTREYFSLIRNGKRHPMYGRHHSEETKLKQSIARNKYLKKVS